MMAYQHDTLDIVSFVPPRFPASWNGEPLSVDNVAESRTYHLSQILWIARVIAQQRNISKTMSLLVDEPLFKTNRHLSYHCNEHWIGIVENIDEFCHARNACLFEPWGNEIMEAFRQSRRLHGYAMT